MLFSKKTKERLIAEQERFEQAFYDAQYEAVQTMLERGRDRDVDLPVHLRRSPEECLSMVKGKTYRVDSLLSEIYKHSGDEVGFYKLISKVYEETLDIVNYTLFVAAWCLLMLDDEKDEETKDEDSSHNTTKLD